MFRKPEDFPKDKLTMNCLLRDNGIGDHIGALVAIDHIIHNCPWINLLVWVPDFLLDFAKNVLPPNAIVRDYTKAKNKYDDKKPAVTTGWITFHTPMRTHGVDFAYHMLVDYDPQPHERNYLKLNLDKINIDKFSLPEKYVAFQATATENVKRMPGKTANQLVDYIKSKGYEIVFVGGSSKVGVKNMEIKSQSVDDLDLSKGINLVGQTNLIEVGKVIGLSRMFLGMDGGLLHIAGSTDVPIVAGYTFINPEHNLPIRNNQVGYNCHVVTPSEELGCRFCQTNMKMLFNHDFRHCYYKDLECLNHMSFDNFKKKLDNVL